MKTKRQKHLKMLCDTPCATLQKCRTKFKKILRVDDIYKCRDFRLDGEDFFLLTLIFLYH